MEPLISDHDRVSLALHLGARVSLLLRLLDDELKVLRLDGAQDIKKELPLRELVG